jgi:predicted P-loop ATPase
MGKDEPPLIIKLQMFLDKKFNFRYNEVLGRTEFQFSNKPQSNYRVLTDYDLNSIYLMLKESRYEIGIEGLRKLLKSRYVRKYNPFKEYIDSLPQWDGITDYIGNLALTVNTTNNEFWQMSFKKWIVAMVGSLLVDDVINHTFLIFTGSQGVGKTTWMQNLIPKQLKDYYYAGAINPSSSDSKIQLAENMLINIDELQGLRYGIMEELKALITTKEIKVRRPYASIHEVLPHRASFVGSANSTDFLSDITGNRRFLCFEIISINNNAINIDNVFAQALYLFKDGFRYWFNQEEIELVNENNESFRPNSLEEETLKKHLDSCDENDESVLFGSATEIINILTTIESKIKVNNSSIQRVGRLLTKHKFKKLKKNGVYVYAYKQKIIEVGYGS